MIALPFVETTSHNDLDQHTLDTTKAAQVVATIPQDGEHARYANLT